MKEVSSSGLCLQVASDLLQLTSRDQTYSLELELDTTINIETTTAEFNRRTKSIGAASKKL
ncbi:unnamed protein product [Heterobilharzia americana]|nr:unnamed protein product [Heterobilharzia americana]